MDSEGVLQGDIGLFRRTSALEFSLTIFSRGGLERKPEQPLPIVPKNCMFRVSCKIIVL